MKRLLATDNSRAALEASGRIAVGRIAEDQLEDFAERTGIGVEAARRRLAPQLG